MGDKNEKATLEPVELEEEELNFDELEEKLQSQLEEGLADMQFLAEEKEKIGNPENLGNVIRDVVWEQFLNQMAVTAGEDFIKENNGLRLDLRDDAHIQTAENFAKGDIATHNTGINNQERYDDWQSNFAKDKSGNVITHQGRSGKDEATLVKGARKPFDDKRPTGSVKKNTDMDHTVPAAEIIRDPAANAHMTKGEQIAFANSKSNLNEMDSKLNRSKSDMSTNEWLDKPNARGQKPDEIFDISAEDNKKMRQKDAEAREEYKKQKKEGEQKSIAEGKKSQKKEAFRIGGKALRTALMSLLAELVREVIAKLVQWFQSAEKGLDTLLDNLKEAIHAFIGKMKERLINAGDKALTAVATAIVGPVVETIKKVWMMLKQGWGALKNAVNYIKDPANKGMPTGRLLMEVGKIVIAGLTGVGALLLGEVIEKSLMAIPIFAVEIPLLGSLANILGIFLGAVVAGIIGAIAINLIEKQIEKSLKRENNGAQIKKGNEVLNLQHEVQVVNEVKLGHTKAIVASDIHNRHVAAADVMADSIENISINCAADETIQDTFCNIDKLFNELED